MKFLTTARKIKFPALKKLYICKLVRGRSLEIESEDMCPEGAAAN
jgi:hypothetical protein